MESVHLYFLLYKGLRTPQNDVLYVGSIFIFPAAFMRSGRSGAFMGALYVLHKFKQHIDEKFYYKKLTFSAAVYAFVR